MRYFYPTIILISALGILTVLFLMLSLNSKDRITFTDATDLKAPSITVVDPSRGPADAKVTVVVFSDYVCLSCRQYESTLTQLMNTFPKDVRIVHKDMPNSQAHPLALEAAIAAQCAGKQKKFWEFHDALFTSTEQFSATYFSQLATKLGLKSAAFDKCTKDQATLPLVERTFGEGSSLGINGTPTTFIGEERWTGAVDLATLVKAVQQHLK